MKYLSLYATLQDTTEAVNEITAQLRDFKAGVVVYFSSTVHVPNQVSKLFKAAFPIATTLGCSTAGELAKGKMLKGSISVMAFSEPAFKSFKVVSCSMDIKQQVLVPTGKALSDISTKQLPCCC